MSSVDGLPNPFSFATGSPFAKRAPFAILTGHDMCRTILDDVISSIFVNADVASEDVDSAFKSVLSALVSEVADQLGPKWAKAITNENAMIRSLKRYANRALPPPAYDVVRPMLDFAYKHGLHRPAFAKRLFDDRAALDGLMRLAFPYALRCIVMVMQREPKLSGTIFKMGKWKCILRMGASSDPAARKDAQLGVNILAHTLEGPFFEAFLAADGIEHFLAWAFTDHWAHAAYSFAGLDNMKKIQVRAGPLCSAMRAPLLTDRVPLRSRRRYGHPFFARG